MIQYPQTDSTAGNADDFARQATQRSSGLIAEFLLFLKWWLLPIVVMLMLLGVGVLIIMGGMALAPFIYGLF